MHNKRENCFQLFIEYAAIEKNNDNKASMHDKEKIQDFDQELKIQSNVNEESKRIPEYKGNLIMHVSYYIKLE